MSLRTRLALLFGLIALAVSALVGGFAYGSTRAEVSGATDDFLVDRASEVADGLRQTPEGRRGDRGQNGNGNLPFDPDSIVQALNADGEFTGTSGGTLPVSDSVRELVDVSPKTGRTVGRFEDIDIDGESFRMYSQALPNGGAIQVARSAAQDDAVLNGLLARFLLIGLAATLLASAAGWWIARRTTMPLRRLADVATTVANTRDFSTQVPVERTDEIGTLARRFREMLGALEQSREQQHRLVHDAGHELRTPLTSLRANTELLERAEGLPAERFSSEERAAVLAAIRDELGELGNLFDEMMELATDTRADDAPMAPCDLSAVVRRTVDRWDRRSDGSITIDTDASMVDGNEAMLERAVTNLLGNAHKFSPPGEPIEVTVSSGAVTVRDSGPGIPVEERTRIFDRFYRSDHTRTLPGSGLGLAIVAQIVERHGGTVWAADAPSGGAEVGFRLPTLAP